MRQILIGLVSPALTALPLARLAFEAWPSDMAVGIGLDLEYRQQDLQAGTGLAALDLRAVETLTATLGGRLLKEPLTDHEERVWVLLPLREETVVLVVDDNQELFELFQRYAVGQAYRLVHAASADQALNLIQSVKPDIITLDLMMPNRDGWEFLRALRSNRASVSIPVIVCSVLEEPELALSLGAQVCLKKPVEQVDLLQALAEAKTMVWAEEARRGLPAHSPVPQSL
jgi:CheY-like chemotaxis protein